MFGVVPTGGGPCVVGTGGSGDEFGSTGSAPGLAVPGVAGVCMLLSGIGWLLPFMLVLANRDFWWWLFFEVVACGAVCVGPVVWALAPELPVPELLELGVCACITAGAARSTASAGSASFLRNVIGIPLRVVGVRSRKARCPQVRHRYSATAYGATGSATGMRRPVTCRRIANAITTNSSAVMPVAPKCCHSTGENAEATEPPMKYAVM